MPAAKQIAANRLNSQKAAGARTAEGKAASRFNALKHGVYAGHHEQYRPSIPTGASSPTLFTTNGVSPAFASFRDFSRTPSPNAPQSPLCAASASPRRRPPLPERLHILSFVPRFIRKPPLPPQPNCRLLARMPRRCQPEYPAKSSPRRASASKNLAFGTKPSPKRNHGCRTKFASPRILPYQGLASDLTQLF